MAIALAPLPLPASANPTYFSEFGREVRGVDPGNIDPETFKEIEGLLYKVMCFPRHRYMLRSYSHSFPAFRASLQERQTHP